jgi:hypothetical protein
MPSITTLRRQAARKGRALMKIREDSRAWWEYGPYCLTTTDGLILTKGLDAEEVVEELASLPDMEPAASLSGE